MLKLLKIESVVEDVLRKHECTRGDNFSLIYYTYEKMLPSQNKKKISDFENVSFKTMLLKEKEKGYPSFESITRARRKLQNQYPELVDKKIEEKRNEKIKDYINYSRV